MWTSNVSYLLSQQQNFFLNNLTNPPFSLVQPEVIISEQVNSETPSVRNLICIVRANPKPDYVNLFKVESGSYARESDTIEDETNPILNKYTRVFTVRDEKDHGEYLCVSKNIYGETRKSHNVTMERPKPGPVQLIGFPANSVLSEQDELKWSIRSQHEINKFELRVSKITQATPGLTKSLVFATDVKPKPTDNNEYLGSYPLSNFETGNSYQIELTATNSYGQSSEIEFDLHVQKSSSSSANQSLICILLIVAVNLVHFSKNRLH